jgi:major membrane immunogen (membrane-anchored lipoprotein)
MLIYLNVIVTGCGKKEEGRWKMEDGRWKKENTFTAMVLVI